MKEVDLSPLADLEGFLGACVADADSGMMINSFGDGFDLETAAAVNSEVVKSKMRAMEALGIKDEIEDILISLSGQYHLIRPLTSERTLFMYVALDRKKANLGLARVGVRKLEQAA